MVKATEAKHTPGPWRLDNSAMPGDGWGARDDESSIEIARIRHDTFDALEVYGRRVRDDYAEHRANARLIAAAPELLEALEDLFRFHVSGGHEGNPDEVERKVSTAISLARGGEGQ